MVTSTEKKQLVRAMFNDIAEKYDFLNHFLSLGFDFYWRKKAIRMMQLEEGQIVMDLATGTGDLALSAVKTSKVSVIGVDIALKMLQIGFEKIVKKKKTDRISFLCADGENLPFKNSIFDRAMIAFGIRNMANIEVALGEMSRTLKDNGRVMILEFSLPENFLMKKIYLAYVKLILPLLGRIISGHPEAYSYLPGSVERFPSQSEFISMMQNSGFSQVHHQKFTFGICTAYIGSK